MKTIKIVLITLLFSLQLAAQTWAPTGAKWTYGIGHAFSVSIGYNEWISTGDTIILGKTCRKISRLGPLVAGDLVDTMFTYEDSNRVYWYSNHINNFTVLYDFNKNAGETWTIQTDTCELIITVDSTGIDTINGMPLKTLFVSTPEYSFSGKIIQYIGHISRPMPYILFSCYGWMVDANYYMGLRCYEDSVLGFYDTGIASNCDYIYTGLDKKNNGQAFSIFPNPTTDIIKIETKQSAEDALYFEVHNVMGQEVKKGVIQNSNIIDITALKAGLYMLTIKNRTAVQSVFKIIKQDR